ncbi:uncharacterized protein TM35_000102730, partial [Trypanosoma theileri]
SRTIPSGDDIAQEGRVGSATSVERPSSETETVSGRQGASGQGAPGTAERERALLPPVSTERVGETHGRAGGSGGTNHALDGAHSPGNIATVPGLWPPANAGGRTRTGQRRPGPPRAEFLGNKAPNARELG